MEECTPDTSASTKCWNSPSEVGQPRSDVLQTQVLHLNVGVAKALDTLFQELQGQMWLFLCQLLADGLDEDGIVGRDTQAWSYMIQ